MYYEPNFTNKLRNRPLFFLWGIHRHRSIYFDLDSVTVVELPCGIISCVCLPADSFTLCLYVDGVLQSLDPAELAVSVKNSCLAGAYCFVYQPADQAAIQPSKQPSKQPNNQLNNQLNQQLNQQLNNQLNNQPSNQRARTCPSSPPPAPPPQSFLPADSAAATEAHQTEEESLISL